MESSTSTTKASSKPMTNNGSSEKYEPRRTCDRRVSRPADVQTTGALRNLSDADWQSSISRNLDTAFFMTRAALGPMIEAGYGRIVNIASVSGPLLAYRGDAAYHAAKAGMVGLTRATAIE